jgi:hypothetical protein
MGVANLAVDAGRMAVQAMGDAINAASDLGETVSKTEVLFGTARMRWWRLRTRGHAIRPEQTAGA